MPFHISTPCYASVVLSQLTNRQVYLKLDALQPCGSFKLRGVGYACEHYAKQGKKRFISSSGGNAGLAVAYTGMQMNIPVVVVVPETTTQHAVHLLKQYQADVIVHGAEWSEANAYAQTLLTQTDAFIHPYDDPLLWQGHSTLIDEVVAAGIKPDALVVAVGGGGLFAGVMQGLKRHALLESCQVITAETQGTQSLAQSILHQQHLRLPEVSGVATSLAASQVAKKAYQLAISHKVKTAVVTDKEALSACLHFVNDHRLVVEPAAGAALSVLYNNHVLLADAKQVLVVVCGGATATVSQLERWYEKSS